MKIRRREDKKLGKSEDEDRKRDLRHFRDMDVYQKALLSEITRCPKRYHLHSNYYL